jgi:S1-C subfamily serine protease
MLSGKNKKILLPALYSLLASIAIVTQPKLLYAGTSTLEKLQGYEDSIVTVKAQVFNAAPGEEKPQAMLSPSGEIVILNNQRVSMLEKTGAGVIVDPNGTIVTNTHVIYGSQVIKVVLRDKSEVPASVLFVSPQYDFSLIKVSAGRTLPSVEWGNSDEAQLGQEIVTIGHSPLLDRTISGGKIVGLGTRTAEDGTVTPELMELNINHYSGDSGGPVFDAAGRFLGLVNAKRSTVDRACFAVPANKIHSAYLNLVNQAQNQ